MALPNNQCTTMCMVTEVVQFANQALVRHCEAHYLVVQHLARLPKWHSELGHYTVHIELWFFHLLPEANTYT